MYDISILHDAMIDQGLTVLELSRRARVPESTIRGIFKEGSGHPQNIKAIADALGFALPDIRTDKKETA